jgi:hypothetical protein
VGEVDIRLGWNVIGLVTSITWLVLFSPIPRARPGSYLADSRPGKLFKIDNLLADYCVE